MGSMYRIKEQMNDFTLIEQKIAHYILEYKDIVIESSVNEVSEIIGVSAATLVRFSKKAGFKGFTNMKVSLAQDQQSKHYTESNLVIDGSESIKLLAEKLRLACLYNIDMTYKVLDMERLQEVSEKVVSARRVFLVGVGSSGVVASDLYQKLRRINKDVFYSLDTNLAMSALTHCTQDDVVICLSYSGTTKEIIHLISVANVRGASTVAITQIGANPLARKADYVINTPIELHKSNFGAICYRNSMFVISDLIYYSIVNHNYETVQNSLAESRQLRDEKTW